MHTAKAVYEPMSIEKMSLVQIAGSMSALDTALMTCCDSEMFHIELPSAGLAASGLHPMHEENPYAPMLEQTNSLLHILGLEPRFQNYDSLCTDQAELTAFLDDLNTQAKTLETVRKTAKDELNFYQQASAQVEHLRGLDARFDDLIHSQHTVTRFGRLPVDSYAKLAYFSRQLFFFLDFDHDEDYYWGLYIAPTSEIEGVDHIFNTLYFEAIEIPDFARGTPEAAMQALDRRIAKKQQVLNENDRNLRLLEKNYGTRLLAVYSYLKMRNDTQAYRKYAVTTHNKFFLEGFVPTKQVKQFIALFEPYDELLCEVHKAEQSSDRKPPTKLRTAKFFKPFEMFVDMYGLPDYNGINPTSFIGFLYVLIFGVMFGDLGQGLLLAIGGYLVYRKKKLPLAAILSRCGVSSCIFGFAYGSVFGFEHLLDPVFHFMGFLEKPIDVFESNTTNMLLVSVLGLGILIIVITIIMNMVLNLRKKEYENVFFSNNGLAGLIFYIGVVAAVVLLMGSGINILSPIFILLVIVLPLLLIFLKEPLGKWVLRQKAGKPEGGVAGFIMQNFFEVFEVVLSYIANSLSFLRIGGFVLSHAGMMAVVMTLAEMAGTVGSIPVVIIGNLFVMGLEAFLVAIQVLRLTFYEVFSRFYEGDGKPFQPVKIDYDQTK